MPSSNPNTLKESVVVREFVGAVRAYSEFIERRGDYSADGFLNAAEVHLKELYRLAMLLPDVSDFLEGEDHRNLVNSHLALVRTQFDQFAGFTLPVSRAEWQSIFFSIREKLDQLDRHDKSEPAPGIVNPNPSEKADPEDPYETNGSFSDDLTDIYRALSSPIRLYDLDTPELLLEALNDWREQFRIEWGLIFIKRLVVFIR